MDSTNYADSEIRIYRELANDSHCIPVFTIIDDADGSDVSTRPDISYRISNSKNYHVMKITLVDVTEQAAGAFTVTVSHPSQAGPH